MIKLFLELSFEPEVAITKDDKIISQVKSTEQHNSDKFMKQVDEAIKKANISLGQVDKICLNVGPGSFTGLRVAAAVAKGLGFNSKIKYQTFSTFDYINEKAYKVVAGFSNMVYTENPSGQRGCEEIDKLNSKFSYVTFDKDVCEKLTNLNYDCTLVSKLPLNKIKLSEDKNINEISLLYLRKSQAEIALENKIKNAK